MCIRDRDGGERPKTEPTFLKAKDLLRKGGKDFGNLAGLTSRGLVQYVILQRMRGTKGAWMLPTEQQFHDATNTMECAMLGDGMEILDVLQWANMWDSVGVIGLSTTNIPLLQEFIKFVSDFDDDDGMEFTVVPKEYVVEDTSLSTILRNVHRRLDLATFPKALYHRNPGLRGGELYVTHSKCYGAGDKARNGQPKEGWQLLFLKGCPIFMQKLEKYPESHRICGIPGIFLVSA